MNKSLFKGCQKDADGNVVDPITLQEIPEERLLTFMENGKKYCFDIEALAEYTRRGRPENPLTREALSEAVQEQLQTYEERAVLIVDRIVTEGDPFPEELEIKHPKTDTEEELIVGICRVLAESIDHELSADEILSDYLVTKHNEVYQVAKKETYKLLDQVIYYEELANYYEGTSELTVFGEVARTAEDNALIAMPFMEAMSYLMDQYNNIYIGLENRRISDYVITMEDYYKTSPVLFGKRAKVIVGHDAFPLPIPSDWDSELKDFDDAGRRRELEELILQSFRLAMNYAIEISNYTLTKKLLTDRIAFEGSRKLDLDIEQILKEFSTEQAYKLLSQFHLPYNIQFLNDFYKKGLLSDLYRIRDKRAADEILRGKTAYLSDPVSQAQVLLLLPDEQRLKHFKKYEDTLDYEVLYASIPKDSSLLDLLSVEEKIEYGFQTGVRLEDFDQVLVAKLLKNRIRISPRKPFHRNGFALLDNFLDDYPYYMDLSIRYKARYVYLAIFHALLGTEEFASNVCKTTAFKDSLIRQVFREASAAEWADEIPKPSAKQEAIDEFLFHADRHFKEKVLAYKLIPTDQLLQFMNSHENSSYLITYLTDGLDSDSFMTYLAKMDYNVSDKYSQAYLLADDQFQRRFAKLLLESGVTPRQTNVLSSDGFYYLISEFYNRMAEGVPELAESVSVVKQ